MKENLPPQTIHFGLRPQWTPTDPMANDSAAEAPLTLRTSPGSLRQGSSLALGATVALVNAFMLSVPTDAQDPEPEPSATQLPEVVVRGRNDSLNVGTVASPKYTETILDTPQTVTVVPAAVIKAQNAVTLRDVLRNVPGISIQAGEGGVPNGDNLSIRGFNARTDLFIDGVRDLSGYTRDSFNFEHVEVVKGPASAYSGRGSTGGSINIVTKTPKPKAFYHSESSYGTDNYKRFTLDLNQPIYGLWPNTPVEIDPSGKAVIPTGKGVIPADKEVTAVESLPTIAFRLNGMWTESESAGRDEVNGRRWGIAPSLAFGLGTPTNVTFTYLHLDQENVPDYGIPWVPETNLALAKYAGQPAPVKFSNFYGILDRDYEITRTDVGTFEVKHAFNDDASLRYLMRYGQTKRDSMVTAPRFSFLDPTSIAITRELQSRDQTDKILANLLDFTTRFKTFGLEHALVMGLEYDRESQENHFRAGPLPLPADLYHPDPHVDYHGTIPRTGAVNNAESDTLSAYLFDTIKLGSHWILSGGLRYDYYSVSLDQKDVFDDVITLDSVDRMLSWRAALSYKPVENGTIYVAYGTSFNPSAEGLTSNFSVRNALLDPEESRTAEVGAKWEFLDHRLLLSAAVFRTEKTNARTAGIIVGEVNVLEGEQSVQGFELGVTGNLTPDWAIFGGYTFIDSQIKSSKNEAEVGNELPNAPRSTFSLWTTYQLPWKIQVGAGVQFVDNRFANATNTREADGYWNFDAMARYEITENVAVQINVYNLADEKYIDRVGGGHFVPGPSRSATASLSLRF